jgi:mono/diheme cytochrome c family protein
MKKRTYFLTLLTFLLLWLAACGGSNDNGAAEEEVSEATTIGDPARGEELYHQNPIAGTGATGCATCHSTEPTDDPLVPSPVGPSHYGVANRAGDYVEGMPAAEYLRESIVDPDAHIAPGFVAGVMYPNYAEDLSEQQINDLVAYLLTLDQQ